MSLFERKKWRTIVDLLGNPRLTIPQDLSIGKWTIYTAGIKIERIE